MSTNAQLPLLISEFRIATSDPEDHGCYQISKDSLRLLLDALDYAEERCVELAQAGGPGRLHPAVIKLRRLTAERDGMIHRCSELARGWERDAGTLTHLAAARLLRVAIGAPIVDDTHGEAQR